MRHTTVTVFAAAVLASLGCEKKQAPSGGTPPPAQPAPAEPTPAEPTPSAPEPEPAPAPPPEVTPPPPAPAPAAPTTRTLPSGVVVEDIKIGDGKEATLDSVVQVYYRGTLRSGEQFDASDPSGLPIDFPLRNLIQGWQEGIPGMKPGGVRKLTIPAAMAYGPEEKRDGTGRVIIPANSDLIFEITLVGVR